MFRIVLAEDSPADEALIREFADRFFAQRGERAELSCFYDGMSMLQACGLDGVSHAGEPGDDARGLPSPPCLGGHCRVLGADCYLLDIEMPGADGFEIAAKIRVRNADVPICFISNLGWLAPEGYTVDAMGFLVKPVSYGQFERLMGRVVMRIDSLRARLIPIKKGKTQCHVDVRRITYAESFKKHSLIHTLDGDVPCADSLRLLEEKCACAPMFRVHNAVLVNLEHVEGVTATDVVVRGEALPLSRHRRQAFLKALSSFVGVGL